MTPLTLPTPDHAGVRVTAGPAYRSGPTTTTGAPTSPSSTSTEPHDDLVIRASRRSRPSRSRPSPPPELSRLGGAPRGCARRPAARVRAPDRADHGHRGSSHAATTRRGRANPAREAAAEISARVRERVTYLPGATEVRRTPRRRGTRARASARTWRTSRSRCCARPACARYVPATCTRRQAAAGRARSDGESSRLGRVLGRRWTALDPTNLAQVGERHVAVAAAATTVTSRRSRGSTGAPRERHAGHGRSHPPRRGA